MDTYLIPRISRLSLNVWRRNWDVFFKTYQVNFLPPFIEPVLYLLAIGFGLGMYVGEINGIPYVNYIAPALLAISIMNASFFECTYSSYVRMYYQKTFDAMIATPLSLDDVITGELLWGATRSLIYSSVMLLVLILFGVVDLPLSLLIIPFSFLAGLLFACIAMCFTAITPGIDALNYPAFLFITPMFLFSGTFFPLEVLPQTVQVIAVTLLPLTQLVIITRSLTLSSLSPLFFYSLLWIIMVTALCFILSLRLMRRRLIV
ncbi:MAG: ABC transporter permease [Methanomicrobiales archaeon]|jgi:lipooligosaccharide transport system permease protein|nr:ABC transporter permease [Methanoregulaceae archaeon]MCC7468649.1 ABC transporter permease [Burkholderiaceae bacterium]NLH25031.1 ABC transporter permease [Methanomicrobiales archaeon]HNB02733.1 ABC transporter permease [Methanoregulaceae archaeon]HNI41211.1 ABC transporter permease [Methanoregulaceae archaeon]